MVVEIFYLTSKCVSVVPDIQISDLAKYDFLKLKDSFCQFSIKTLLFVVVKTCIKSFMEK